MGNDGGKIPRMFCTVLHRTDATQLDWPTRVLTPVVSADDWLGLISASGAAMVRWHSENGTLGSRQAPTMSIGVVGPPEMCAPRAGSPPKQKRWVSSKPVCPISGV